MKKTNIFVTKMKLFVNLISIHYIFLEQMRKQIESLQQENALLKQIKTQQEQLIVQTTEEKRQIESQLVEAKMNWATIELERDNLLVKYASANDKVQQITYENNQLQLNLIRTK